MFTFKRFSVFWFLRGWRLVALGVVVLLLGLVASGVLVGLVFPQQVAVWALERTFPELRFRLGHVHWATVNAIEVKDATVVWKGDEGVVFELDRGVIQIRWSDIRARQIDSVRLEKPHLRITRDIPHWMPKSRPTSSAPPKWLIRRFEISDGRLTFEALGERIPNVTLHVQADLQNFGTACMEAEGAHVLELSDAVFSLPDPSEKVFARLDKGKLRFTNRGVFLDHRLEALEVSGGYFELDSRLVSQEPAPAAAQEAEQVEANHDSSTVSGWILGKLEVQSVKTTVQDLVPSLPKWEFVSSMILNAIPLSQATGALLQEVRQFELADISVPSPLNPHNQILSMRSIFVRFTLGELLKHRIRELVVLNPTIYLSQDLFVYMDRAKVGGEPQAGGSPQHQSKTESPWTIDHLDVKFGTLVIGASDDPNVGLPLGFETTVENVAFDRLAELQLQAALRVPKQSYAFESYQLALENVEGDLRFAYPPEKGENNVVQKLKLDRVRWRQYSAEAAWMAVTFDKVGISGRFGGKAYSGYVEGGFSFFFADRSPWVGWVSGVQLDTKEITGIAAPENFQMTGPMDLQVEVDAFQRNIERVRGFFRVTEPGDFRVTKLDALLAEIPANWPALKKSSSRILLEALRDFSYTKADGDLWFAGNQGILHLDLEGANGHRKLDVVLHANESTEGRWQDRDSGVRSSDLRDH